MTPADYAIVLRRHYRGDSGGVVARGGRSVTRALVPQLVRFRKRAAKAHDALDHASYYLLEALRSYDGDKVSTKFPEAMAWEYAKSVESAIDALAALLAAAETYADEAMKP